MSDVIAVVHRVADVVAAAAFFERVLWMTRVDDGRLSSGALELRLLPLGELAQQPTIELEVSTASARECAVTLLQEPDACVLPEPSRSGPERIEIVVRMRHGVVVRVVQTFDEDELGVLPPLPTALEWRPDAMLLVQTTLRVVPLAFRDLARKRMTERAEYEACAAGLVEVDIGSAVRGMVAATPVFQQAVLREALAKADVLHLAEAV